MIKKLKNIFKKRKKDSDSDTEIPSTLIEIILDESNTKNSQDDHPNYIITLSKNLFLDKQGITLDPNIDDLFLDINIGYDDRFLLIVQNGKIMVKVLYEFIVSIRHRYSHNEKLIWSDEGEL